MRGGYHVLSRIKQLLLTTDGLRNYSRYLKHNKDLDCESIHERRQIFSFFFLQTNTSVV